MGYKMDTDCIFCKIVQGDIPCSSIYEDQHLLAFLDINPFSPGHSLLITREHYNRLDQCPDTLIAHLAKKLGPLASAITSTVGADDYNILNNNGPASGQIIEHLHFHIIPRTANDSAIRFGPHHQYPPGRLEKLAQNIRKSM